MTPPPVASSSGLGLPPVAGDFTFLEEPGPKARPVSESTTVFEPEIHKKQGNRRRQLILIVSLLVTFIVLVVAFFVVNTVMNEPAAPSPQVAARPAPAPIDKSKAEPAVAEKVKGKGPATAGSVPPSPGSKTSAAGADRAAKPPAAPADEPKKWINAKDSVAIVGDIEVKIRSAGLGSPKEWIIPSRVGKSTQFLVLTLELSNHSKTRKIDHFGWGARSPAGAGVRLTDDVETPNNYALKGGAIGQGSPEPIYPGQPVEDKLLFERPIDAAKVLRLQLPASAFGAKGMVLFEIPREMIVQMAEQPEPPLPATEDAKRTAKAEQQRAKPGVKKSGEPPDPSGDPMVDFGLKESDNRKGRSPAEKRPLSKEESEKADRDRQTKESGSTTQAGLREIPADKEGDKRGSGFGRANQQQSPF